MPPHLPPRGPSLQPLLLQVRWEPVPTPLLQGLWTGLQLPMLTSGGCRKTREGLKKLLLCFQDYKEEGRRQGWARVLRVLPAGRRLSGEQRDPDLRSQTSGGGRRGVTCALCPDVTSRPLATR